MNVRTVMHSGKALKRQVKNLDDLQYVTIDNVNYEVVKTGDKQVNAVAGFVSPIYKTGRSFIIHEVPVFREEN